MSASKINKLRVEHQSYYESAEYAGYMAGKSKGKKRNEFEDEENHYLEICDDIAGKILKLKPSKYMLNKYPELQDILESI